MPLHVRWLTNGALGLALLAAGCGEGLLSAPADDASDGGTQWDLGAADARDAAAGRDAAAAADAEVVVDATAGPPADCPRVAVRTPGTVLNVRPNPDTGGAPVGTLADGTIADVLAVVQGEALDGNSTWYEIASGSLRGFVWSGLVDCVTAAPPPTGAGFYLPFACGKRVKCTQGNNTTFSHKGDSAYAFDFSLGIGTQMVAMDAGTVSYVYNKTQPGDPCYDGGGPSCIDKANLVWVKHADGTQTIYGHLSKVSVALGQKVTRGQLVGLSGQTGYSTGPHAHVGRMRSCCKTIPMKFEDVSGSGVPATGDYVTSGNCP